MLQSTRRVFTKIAISDEGFLEIRGFRLFDEGGKTMAFCVAGIKHVFQK